MIRNVVVGRAKDGVTPEQVDAAIDAMRGLRVEGVNLRLTGGRDLGLREGNASFSLVVDLDDAEAYKIYDADPEHNRIRAELFAPIFESINRVQFSLSD
jgi:lipoate-protein ligase A